LSKAYTDEERVEIAKKEYDDWKLNYDVTLENDKSIGVISQVNDKSTGEQSFVITDKYCSPTANVEQRNQVKEVTVLYRGSTGVDKIAQEPVDVYRDWIVNDVTMASNVLGRNQGSVSPQLKSSAETLKNVMSAYPNAEVFVYGHSLGSMNAQYAVADLSDKDSSRIGGGFFYQGPNVYETLTPAQKITADALTKLNKLFNYVDSKDLVPIGYGTDKMAVGNVIKVNSKKVGIVGQHMWGGYDYNKDGSIKTDKVGNIQLAKYTVNQQLSAIDIMRKKFIKSGGGLSSSEEIFLDASEAMAITKGMKQTISGEITELKQMYQEGIKNAEDLWKTTKSNAEGTGQHLSYGECLDALDRGNVTESNTVREPVHEYEEKLAKVTKISRNYDELLQKIGESITKQLETDQELANQIRSM
jgi:hypothetical protein